MAFRDRLKLAVANAKVEYSQTAIANSLGIKSKQTVDRWMGDGMPGAEMIFTMADRWGVDARWLATGDGEMLPRVPVTTARQPGATYASVSESALEVARGFDLLTPDCKEHVRRQIELLRGAPGNGGRRRAAQQDVRIKRNALQSGQRLNRKKDVP